MDPTTITTRTATTTRLGNGIIVVKAHGGIHHSYEDSVANQAATDQLAQGKRYLLLLDLRLLQSQDREGRHVYTDAPHQPSALAVIVGSPVGRVIGNLFITLKRSQFPAKLFTDYDKAYEWLQTFVEPEQDKTDQR